MKYQDVADSPFGNTYGGLTLVKGEDGNHYLEMYDCFGPDYFGPLTDAQKDAFFTLRDVQEV